MSDTDDYTDVESEVEVDVEPDDDSEARPPRKTSNKRNTGGKAKADKKAHHNFIERDRRKRLKIGYHGLAQCIPELQNRNFLSKSKKDKPTPALIVTTATKFIQQLDRLNSTTQKDIHDIQKQNQELENQIRALEESACANVSTDSDSDASDGGKTKKKQKMSSSQKENLREENLKE